MIIDFISYNEYVGGGGRMGLMHPVEPWPLCNCPFFSESEEVAKIYRNHYDGVDRKADFNDEQYLICPP